VAHFFGPSGVDFYSGSGREFSALFHSISLKKRGDFYLDHFFGGSGVDFYSVMEQTRRVDLYWGGFEHFSAFYFVKECAGLRIEEDASEYKIGM